MQARILRRYVQLATGYLHSTCWHLQGDWALTGRQTCQLAWAQLACLVSNVSIDEHVSYLHFTTT